MLMKSQRGFVAWVAPLIILLFLLFEFYDGVLVAFRSRGRHTPQDNHSFDDDNKFPKPPQEDFQPAASKDALFPIQHDISRTHREVFSASTMDRKYFFIDFGERHAMNPSIIPHPDLDDTWIVTAQQHKISARKSVWFAELVCDAVFKDGVLRCAQSPFILPIAATSGHNCVGDLDYFNLNIGPHDARVFYGPSTPYAIYGSNGKYNCFGMWILDFRLLVDWAYEDFAAREFGEATELQRPPPYGAIEKNWFIFWDSQGEMYAHFDITPTRSFAKLAADGSVGEDLAVFAAAHDAQCMAQHMPTVAPELESIHQATNSLSITLCDRSDSACEVTDANTFILTIFQHKSFYSFHGVYEPYIMLFKRSAPFEIYAISSKPIWIHGRGKPGEWDAPFSKGNAASKAKNEQAEMFYITSMSWKTHTQKYHGYRDDVLFVAFGIEDSNTGAIDVVASDLLMDLQLCSTG